MTGQRRTGRDRDQAEVEAVLRDHGAALMRLALALTRTPADAEDLWQDTVVDALHSWSRVAEAGAPRAYLRAMLVRRHVSNHRRRWRRERPVDPSQISGAASPDPTALVDGDDHLRHLVANLPPRTRAVLVLRYVEDLDDRTIAEVLGVTASTVSALASRGLARLREEQVR